MEEPVRHEVAGGVTSHAAVVARGMGKPCIVGCGVLKIDDEAGTMRDVSPRFQTA
jgi:pyruvate,orthophosphate dikinase